MQPEPERELPVLRREVERPGSGGHGLLPVVVLAAAMASTLAAAAMAMSVAPRAHHCPRTGRSLAPAASAFVRPAAPAPRVHALASDESSAPSVVVPPRDPRCAPRVYHGHGDAQEWTYETCATAPMPRRFVFSR